MRRDVGAGYIETDESHHSRDGCVIVGGFFN